MHTVTDKPRAIKALKNQNEYRISPQQMIEKYLSYCTSVEGLAENTFLNRKYVLTPFFRSLELSDLRNLTLQMIDDHLAGTLKRTGEAKEKSTINSERQILRSFLWFCQTYHEVDMQFDWSMVRRVKVKPPRVTVYSPATVARVVNHCAVRQDGLMIAVLYESGMRIGELAQLTADNVCGCEIRLRGKGEKDRVVYITSKLARELEVHIARNCTNRKSYVFKPIQLHSNQDNYCYKPSSIRDRIEKRFVECGYEMHPHELRHGFAIEALRGGMDIRTLQLILGHSNVETTMRYLQLTDDHTRQSYAEHFKRSVS